MIPLFYVLEDGQAVVAASPLAWAQAMQTARHVALTEVCGTAVSTVFLGIDVGHNPDGPPVLFETALVGPRATRIVDRYCTLADAEAGHAAAVARQQALCGVKA